MMAALPVPQPAAPLDNCQLGQDLGQGNRRFSRGGPEGHPPPLRPRRPRLSQCERVGRCLCALYACSPVGHTWRPTIGPFCRNAPRVSVSAAALPRWHRCSPRCRCRQGRRRWRRGTRRVGGASGAGGVRLRVLSGRPVWGVRGVRGVRDGPLAGRVAILIPSPPYSSCCSPLLSAVL